MDILATIAERKISEAMARGEFDDLPGRGKPLALEDELAGVPAELRMAYKILKNAGFVPPEVELRREILSLRQLVDRLDDDAERKKKQQELDVKILKLSMMLRRPLDLDHFSASSELEVESSSSRVLPPTGNILE
ncbi:MAG TPA: DUF1992 domain-containing protein [Desulfuromonadales bacterium]|nr:DUF1992 domain-containing protein [Desulfuromonadales bacterium]